jgi:thymidine kinase
VAKLYFRYGTMDSAKSMNLLAVAHNYRKQGKKVLLVKPRLDTRFLPRPQGFAPCSAASLPRPASPAGAQDPLGEIPEGFGATKISSRCGLAADADVMVDADSVLDPRDFAGLDCVLVDEAQFLAPSIIEDLRRITVDPGVPVICYGLRTDFRTKLFPGAQRLMELADRIEDEPCRCFGSIRDFRRGAAPVLALYLFSLLTVSSSLRGARATR